MTGQSLAASEGVLTRSQHIPDDLPIGRVAAWDYGVA